MEVVKKKRLGKHMISHAVELLKLVKSIHLDCDHCLSKRPEACHICPNIAFLQKDVAAMPMGMGLKNRINGPLSLASRLQMTLVGCYARHEYFLRPEGWISSTTGLLKLRKLLDKPEFAKERRIWRQVVAAHLTIGYHGNSHPCTPTQTLGEDWIMEEMRKEGNKAI
jgi:hypothetical protein